MKGEETTVSDAISVLIVDDSALMRNLISRMIEATPGLAVAERAMNGVFALQKITRCDPDVIVLDLEMPEMNGIEFLRERKRLGIEVPVIILSSIARRGAEITMEALALGASDFIMKPSGSVSEDIHTVKDLLTGMLLAYGSQFRIRRGKPPSSMAAESRSAPRQVPPAELHTAAQPARAEAPKPERMRKSANTELIVIGISTGGPNALREVFSKLDPDLSAPIVVVQHMPAGFTAEFAKSLDRICPLEVKEAEDGDLVKSGRVLIAPGDKHIEIERRSLAAVARLSDEPPVNGHRPSADVLFASAAREFGNRTLGVIMTGMGRDGARELGSIYREGGITLGQNEASCVVYGMPRVAYEVGHVMEQVSLDKMAERICAIAKERR
ncbi:MAG TPA: chemotaxis response regulator protein-glutamate methylesterase [Treponema sp.]|nr:MAG: chemotaxis response regulator protein-glutamate methylesterase [Treponema sp. GWC1_61_84]OHE75827.1 MAG: chemotaxis response regulator protein-glutamate methylesterase [Treponema sp. RIFOXYC1_FULL_61_9]HCM28842.1 chemotaxis response regulator protein-glutamate methylesterase [Treponema sp.]